MGIKLQVKKLANVFYHQTILKIGGVERYLVETITKYAEKGYDIDFYYRESMNDEYLELIAKAIGKDRVHQYHGEKIRCDTLFINYEFSGFLEKVIADKVYNVVHANFDLERNYPLHTSPKITDRLAVSETNAKAFKKRFNIPCKTCYNPITITKEDTRRVLTLVSATRLTKEKGKERMLKLMEALDKANIPYYWHIFTNRGDGIDNPHVMIHEPTLDVRPYINDADYLVQLSSSEGYCYAVLEALTMKTPVIVSDLEVFKKEMGVKNGVNGFILPLDMKNIPIKDIYEKKLEFDYKPKEDSYDLYLSKEKTRIITEDIMRVKVKALKPFYDVYEDLHVRKKDTMYFNPNEKRVSVGDTYETTYERAIELSGKGYVELTEDIKPTKRKTKKK